MNPSSPRAEPTADIPEHAEREHTHTHITESLFLNIWRRIPWHLQGLSGRSWAGRHGCSGRPEMSADGFGPWLVAGSLYSAPSTMLQGARRCQLAQSPNLSKYRCVHIYGRTRAKIEIYYTCIWRGGYSCSRIPLSTCTY